MGGPAEIVLLVSLWAGGLVNDVLGTPARAFGFEPSVVEDIFYVAQQAKADPFILASLVNRESGGNRGVVRYCLEWATETRCSRERSCYTDCQREEIWKNHLDLGLWQLRDAPTWSWLRWYARLKRIKHLRATCAMERDCSRTVMIAIIPYLRHQAAAGKRKCRRPLYAPGYQWLGGWNGCNSYANHTKTARALWGKVLGYEEVRSFWYNTVESTNPIRKLLEEEMADTIKVMVSKLGADDVKVEVPEGLDVCKVVGHAGLDARGCTIQVNGKNVDSTYTVKEGDSVTLVTKVAGGK